MIANTNAVRTSSDAASPEGLSDSELLATTRILVGRSNQLLAALLAHLGEVEARGLHRMRACASLYTYCVYELRFSEDAAFRRVSAARLVRRFPALFDAVARGELHLTGLLLLGPHLAEDNLTEVLARAKHRTKKEILRLVRQLDPLPDVPSRIEPLGPAPARIVPPAATWKRLVESRSLVRELRPGERPADWTDEEEVVDATHAEDVRSEVARAEAPVPEGARPPEPLAPQRFKVQFTASEEYVSLVERAKALLSHALPEVEIEEIQLRALRHYVAELEKERYGAATPRRRGSGHAPSGERANEPAPAGKDKLAKPRQRGRAVPAAVRRAVFERDGARCSYVHDSGTSCSETRFLELHHLTPFAEGGEHSVSNIALRCRAHNALAAEQDFGRVFIEDKQDSQQHESFRSQERDHRRGTVP